MISHKISKISLMLCLLSCSVSQAVLSDYTCGAVDDQGSRTVHTFCDDQGEILKIEKIFKKTGTVSVREFYKSAQLTLRQSYNTQEKLVREFGFEYPNDESFFKISYKINTFPRIETGRALYRGSIEASQNEL